MVKILKGAGGVGFLPLIATEEKKRVEQEAEKTGPGASAPNTSRPGWSFVVNDMLLSPARGASRSRGSVRLHHHLGLNPRLLAKATGVVRYDLDPDAHRNTKALHSKSLKLP